MFDSEFRRGFEQSCRLCRDVAFTHKREEWGCDAPVAEPWDYVECFVCEDRSSSCSACEGTRRLPLDRCPWSYLGPREQFVCEAAAHLETGIEPWTGGWAHWPASFTDALQIVLSERAVIREKEAERLNRRQ